MGKGLETLSHFHAACKPAFACRRQSVRRGRKCKRGTQADNKQTWNMDGTGCLRRKSIANDEAGLKFSRATMHEVDPSIKTIKEILNKIKAL